VTVAPNAVSSARFGQLASILPDCGSTQDIVRAAAGQNAPEGFLAVTDHQTAGRGRLGRTWSSPPGQSLLFSLLLRPDTPPAELAPLTLVAGLAVAEALPVEARVRWPNDVVIGGAKLAGILAELETRPDGTSVVFLGVGVNANVPAADLPETERLPATSLLVELGAPVDRLALLERVIDLLQAAYREFENHGFRALFDRYAALDALTDAEVTLQVGEETVTGRGAGVDAGGRLVLDLADGRRAFEAGEVVHVLDAP
jgi:BirA family biotin operon repressor/biotin-[acetyl-CoA-carboxylase] ligase